MYKEQGRGVINRWRLLGTHCPEGCDSLNPHSSPMRKALVLAALSVKGTRTVTVPLREMESGVPSPEPVEALFWGIAGWVEGYTSTPAHTSPSVTRDTSAYTSAGSSSS